MSDRNGSVSTFDRFSVADVRGTWREMGRQCGSLLSGHIKHTYEIAEARLIGSEIITKDDAYDEAGAIFANYPHRMKELVVGMSETSGLDIQQHIFLNAIEHLSRNDLRTDEDRAMHGTGIAVWGEYAMANLVYGRNHDYAPWFRDLAEKLVAVVYHPCDGSLAVASIGYPGCVSMTTGINERGIFIELNNGEPSGGALRYSNRIQASTEAFAFMFDSADLDQLESFIFTTRADAACVIGVADERTSRCYEWPVFDVKRRLSIRRPGLMVATDHFTEPSWGLPRPDDTKFFRTRTRRQNLLTLAEHFKGSIDLTRMKKIMDTRIEDLGATTDDTVYQVVAEPGSMILSLKVPDLTDWVDIKIGDFLRTTE